LRSRSLADYTIDMHESEFSEATPYRACHGPGLKGLGPIPGITGRSPSYIVRQLYDFKHGTRAGIGSALMKGSVEKLAVEDMVARRRPAEMAKQRIPNVRTHGSLAPSRLR
jgi:cytochrome c553